MTRPRRPTWLAEPPVGACLRTVLPTLLSDPSALRAAYALETSVVRAQNLAVLRSREPSNKPRLSGGRAVLLGAGLVTVSARSFKMRASAPHLLAIRTWPRFAYVRNLAAVVARPVAAMDDHSREPQTAGHSCSATISDRWRAER
jgi:hypothetical protein